MKVLLDTNIISEIVARQPNRKVVDWLDSLDPNLVYLTVITIGELQKGISRLPDSERRDNLRAWLYDRLLNRFSGRILLIDEAVMLTWGELVARLEREGRPLPALDSLIAALALHHNCTLATRNEKDFLHSGVSLINPWRAE
jgi:toxin FitB